MAGIAKTYLSGPQLVSAQAQLAKCCSSYAFRPGSVATHDCSNLSSARFLAHQSTNTHTFPLMSVFMEQLLSS